MRLRLTLQILLPVVVLAAAAGASYLILSNIEKPRTEPPPRNIPLVRVVTVAPETVRLDVRSQGTVQPRTEVMLSPQVSGRVVAISPNLRAGGFFDAGEVLLGIEKSDYELALVQREADVARAMLKLKQEEAEAEVALRAWQQLEGEREPDELATRELHVKGARAELMAAEAALERARLDLQRTEVTLPFPGRVRAANVDLGQQVLAGQSIADVYGIRFAEVRLPIPDDQVAFVDLPLGLDDGNGQPHPVVELFVDFAGTRYRWLGDIARTEGEIDSRTRQLTAVARVESPYTNGEVAGRPPLKVGMFVEAGIHGRTFEDVMTVPRAALRNDGTVLVVDAENHLQSRRVQVLRADRRTVQVRGGLDAGDRVCVSFIEAFVEGMPVQIIDELPSDGAPLAPGGR